MVEIRLLGDVAVYFDGHAVDIGPARQRCVLAILLVEPDVAVSIEQLIDRVWADEPPLRARSSLYTYLTRLRRALEPGQVRVDRRHSGYFLSVDKQAVDLYQFRELVRQARAAPNGLALALLERALRLWRGGPFAGLDTPWLRAVRTKLERERLEATHQYIDLMLGAGRHAEVLPVLATQLDLHPLDERLVGQLMLARYRSGNKADALLVFHEARHALASQLGIEPGVELRQLHERILRADPELSAAPPPVRKPLRRNVLPGDIADFTGRVAEVDRLLSGLAAGTVVISAIDGMAGIGKTTLAVHLAHRLTGQYPDAQLFIDLHGHTAGHEPVEPSTALDTLLRTLGVPSDQIPSDLAAKTALWRAELAERKAIVVLDNAAGAAQVRPLLPGATGCLIIVTSRSRLLDLDVAHNLSLDVLPRSDAINLLWHVLGDGRVADEPDAVTELVELCGCLPLALRIAAARLRSRPVWTVSHLVARLRAGQRVLTELSAGDRSVAAAFTLSYSHLPAAHQQLFRLLGLAPGPDIDTDAAAALVGADPPAARDLLEDLVDAHLLQQRAPGRYRFHDLLRQHAETTARLTDSDSDQQAALRRLVDHYVHAAYAADRLIFPGREPIQLDPVQVSFADQDAALAWFDVENANLLAVQRLSVGQQWHASVWQLAWAMDTILYRRGHLHDHLTVWQAGLTAAEHLGDRTAQTLAHRLLGRVYARAGQSGKSMSHLEKALSLAEHTGDQPAQARTHHNLSLSWEAQGDYQRAIDHATQALSLFRSIDNPPWVARTLSAVGWFHAQLRDYTQARTYCEQALPIYHSHPDPQSEAHTLDSLGYIEQQTGRYTEARDYFQRSATQFRAAGNSYAEADTLDRLAQTHTELGEENAAQTVWHQALHLYEAQNRTADADRVRRSVQRLDV